MDEDDTGSLDLCRTTGKMSEKTAAQKTRSIPGFRVQNLPAGAIYLTTTSRLNGNVKKLHMEGQKCLTFKG